MQGIKPFISTEKKINFLNSLLKVGFDTLDFGSFVSPKAVPQMSDTVEVLKGLNLSSTKTKLLAIVANMKGAEMAAMFDEIHYLGFPFSISRTFSELNINANVWKAYSVVNQLLELCDKTGKELVLYISMAFGNPYGDKWSPDIVYRWVNVLYQKGVRIMALSDTVGVGNAAKIGGAFNAVVEEFSDVEFGAHLHTTADNWYENVDAAYKNGCRRFDTVINGLGGCPMSKQKLVGNLPTCDLISYLDSQGEKTNINSYSLNKSRLIAAFTYPEDTISNLGNRTKK